MYESYKTVFDTALDNHDHELLIAYKDHFNRGFEVPLTIEHEDRQYHFRMIILYDSGLFARKRRTVQNRIEKTKTAFAELNARLNKYKLKTYESIKKACDSILKKYHTTDLFHYTINNDPIITYKNKKRGRPGPDAKKIAVTTDQFSVKLTFNQNAFENVLDRCGYYPLITNKGPDSLTIKEAMMAHKGQYKSEHTYRRSKGPYNLEPIYLHTPERIEALLLLFKIALQVIVLIERTARETIQQRDKGLNDFMPNRKDVRNPKTEYLLCEFEYIVQGQMRLPDGNTYGFVSELNPLQQDILEILQVQPYCYSYEYLFDSS
jgi:transposase